MNILVATKTTQGMRKSDFCFCKEYEYVRFGCDCDSDNGNIDGGCGCQRSVCGWDTAKGTTTFMVVTAGVTKDEYLRLFIKAMTRDGWFMGEKPRRKNELGLRMVNELLEIADRFPVGTILERRGETIQVRRGALQHRPEHVTKKPKKYASMSKDREPVNEVSGEMIKCVLG